MDTYSRQVQTSVTNFLYYGDQFLFMKRNPDRPVDANKVNGIGGRLEIGEDYLTAAIRETHEEAGYIVTPSDVRFCGIVKLHDIKGEDWVMGFFAIRVPHLDVPHGMHSAEGDLFWVHKDKVLNSGLNLVDDINYCFDDIVSGANIFFITAHADDDLKLSKVSAARIPVK